MPLEDTIKQVFLENGNKILNKSLAEKFKEELSDEYFKVEFKKIVAKIATVKEEDGQKYLILRAKYHRKTSANGSPPQKVQKADGLQASILQALTGNLSFDESTSCSSAADFEKLDFFDNLLNSPTSLTMDNREVDISTLPVCKENEQVEQKPAKFTLEDESSSQNRLLPENPVADVVGDSDDGDNVSNLPDKKIICAALEDNQNETPEADKNHSDNHFSIDRHSPVVASVPHFSNSESDLQTLDGKIRITINDHSDENAPPKVVETPKSPTIPVVNVQKSESDPNIADVTVKARAKLYATGLNVSNLNRKSIQYQKNKARQSAKEDSLSPEGSVASITLSEPERQWLLTCAKCDYQNMVKSLLAHPELMDYSDFTCGYSGLHFAAKTGNLDAIKLLAGKYKADVNCKTGYAPLHLAAMHGQRQAFSLLIETYGANQSARDNSGRKAEEYVNNAYGTKRVKISDLAAHKAMSINPRSQSPTKSVKNSYSSQSLPGSLQFPSGHIRIGSLRKAGTAALSRLKGHSTNSTEIPEDSADTEVVTKRKEHSRGKKSKRKTKE